jgi:hypothetical protein
MNKIILYYLWLDDNKELILKEKFKERDDIISNSLEVWDIMTNELYENKFLAEAFYKQSKDFYDSHKWEFPNYIFDPRYRMDDIEYSLYKFNWIYYNMINDNWNEFIMRWQYIINQLNKGNLIWCDTDIIPKELYIKFISSLNDDIKKYEWIINKKQKLVSKYNKLLISN